MRVEGSVTSVSWIPSASVTGAVYGVPFEMGISHYDDPPPDVLASIDALLQSDRARFVNDLRAWIDVDEGVIVGHGQCGNGRVGATTLRIGGHDVRLAAVAMPTRRRTERLGIDAVRFVQTAGARTGAPCPRRVNRAPFVQLAAPLAWTTLSLTLRADGTQDFQLGGASPFPRHWLYNGDNRLVAKSAVIDYKRWSTDTFGGHTPWGGADSPAFIAEAEPTLERELSVQIMRPEARQTVRRLPSGDRLTEQGEPADQVFLLLDGVLRVEVDGKALADIGPGSVLGERAGLEAGHRTASLTPVTRCTVAVVSSGFVDTPALEQLAQTHRRENQTC
jgi:hypothetical protein